MRHTDIKTAINHVAKNPQAPDAPIDSPMWELITRNLFMMANGANPAVRGSIARANAAQRIILNRTAGRRRPGTRPIQHDATPILTFRSLTGEDDDEQ